MLIRARQIGVAAVLCGGLMAVANVSATAQQPGTAREALEAWIAEIDAEPEVNATYESITGNAGEAVLTGLTITGQELIMTFEPITVTGYRDLPPTGYAFETFDVGRVQARTPTREVNIIDLSVTNLTVPETFAEANVSYQPKRPISSVLDIWGVASRISIDEIAIGRIDLGAFEGGLNSVVSYHNYVISGVADGRIAAMTAGPLVMEAPSPDELFVLTVDSVRDENIDFNAIARVFDPAAYEDGDRDWRTVIGHSEYTNIIVQAPELQLRIRSVVLDNFEARQAAVPFAPVLERLMADASLSAREADELMQSILVDLISPWGLGGFTISGLDLYADDVDRFHIGDFHIDDLSLDGLGEIGLGDVDIVVGGEGYFRADKIAIGGVQIADEETLKAALAAFAEGAEPETIADLIPDVAYVEIAGFAFGTSGTLPVTLDRLLIRGGGYVDALPTAGEIEVRGATVPLTIIGGEVRQILNRLGFTEFVIDLGIYVEWNEANQTLVFDNLHIAVNGAGSIEARIELGGVTREIMENPDAVGDEVILAMTLHEAEIRIRDESVADRLFRWTAEGNDIPPDQYRAEFIAGLPLILGLTIDRTIALEISPPLQQFLREPSELVVTVGPAEPVSLAEMIAVIETSPFALLDLLGVDLTVTPLR